ncbi:hypothetical protein LOTGIDRAFT_163209 [Lottia gigantea]|uniref:Phospholipase A2-like domain-containing protein n=1 Tax=Lottia gigantea TaxID=225164 RepID=V4A9Y5_LOTGI|nr:hypothetical protein LOTGIDRAFT_163209 [Lottia gigantea]ESO91850.1 hypothetical protein LOTGIDRAFT_163209 [Lottia gigantea]
MIVAHAPKTYFGSGDIQKSLGSLPGFPWAKYPGEKHLPGHNYTGPGTRLDLRLDENDKPKLGEETVNRVDAAALKHDILYRNKDIKFRHEADKQMITELENIPNPTFKERMERALIIKLLKAKMKLVTSFIRCQHFISRRIFKPSEIETKNGKYVDTFKMEVENDKDIIGIKDLDMILETENPPSTNIAKIPRRLHVHEKIESTSHEFLRTTDFEYVKLYFALGEKYTSIDVHKSQQEREFIVHLSFAEDSILEGGGFIFRAKINIEKEKIKYSYHLNEDHTKKEISLVRVNVFTFNTRKYNNARPNKHALYDIPWFYLSEIHLI